ncbi:MAG: HAD family hydrolase, partial [Chloroflexota bacterium]
NDWIGHLIRTAETYAPPPPSLKNHLEQTLGLDSMRLAIVPDSPFAVTTIGKIEVVAMTVLYQQGYAWDVCETILDALRKSESPPPPTRIVPLGNVPAHLKHLKAAGLTLVLATNDDRPFTQKTIETLGMEGLFSMVLCGDDSHPSKPDPAGINLITAELDIPPEKMMMVGDTLSDMKFAQNGGVAYRIGVDNTSGPNGQLESATHAVIQTIDEIVPVVAPAI